MSEHTDERVAEEQYQVDWMLKMIDERIARREEETARIDDPAVRTHQLKVHRKEEDRLRALTQHEKGMLWGRIDFLDDPDFDRFYIGRSSLEDGEREPLIIDWQSPIAQPFYEATPDDPQGLGRRSDISLASHCVKRVEDLVFSSAWVPSQALAIPAPPGSETRKHAGDESDAAATPPEVQRSLPPATAPARDSRRRPGQSRESPTGYVRARDTVLDELEADRSGQMQEAARTLQAAQFKLVSAKINRPIIIQGGPGTGKTIVALHRASWVLYQQSKAGLSEASCLVVGPNQRFVDYISDVLPSLGDGDSVTQTTVALLGMEQVPIAARDRLVPTRVDDKEQLRIKGSRLMIKVLETALWARGADDVTLNMTVDERPVSLSAAVFGELRRRIYDDGLSYSESREAFVRRVGELVEDRIRQLELEGTEEGPSDGEAPQEESQAERQARIVASNVRQKVVERIRSDCLDRLFPTPRPHALVRELLTRRGALAPAAAGLLTRGEVDALVQPGNDAYQWSDSDLALIDEAADLLGERPRRYSHVVVDEAQDLSPMQWRMIARRARNNSITAVGDLAQGTAVWSPETWERVLEANELHDGDLCELELGYRVPRPVLQLANKLLPYIVKGLAKPKSLRSGARPKIVEIAHGEVPAAMQTALRDLPVSGTAAVICGESTLNDARSAVGSSPREATVLTPLESKGLEFDHVVLVDPEEVLVLAEDHGPQQLYIALTRCTKTVTILTVGLLPEVLR